MKDKLIIVLDAAEGYQIEADYLATTIKSFSKILKKTAKKSGMNCEVTIKNIKQEKTRITIQFGFKLNLGKEVCDKIFNEKGE